MPLCTHDRNDSVCEVVPTEQVRFQLLAQHRH